MTQRLSNMEHAKPNIIVRLFRAIWRGFNALRKVLHFILLAFIFVIVIAVLSPDTPTLPKQAALVIAPNGSLTEQLAGSPLDRAIGEATGNVVGQTLVRDVVDALEYAAKDDRIKAVYLSTDGLMSGDLTKLKAVSEALVSFKESGKPIIAYGAYFSQQGYYLAAVADQLLLDENGAVLAEGYGRYRNYYKDAIDKLSISWNVFKVGTHKSFVEPYTRNDMSPEDRAGSGRWLNALWASYTGSVEAARGLDAGTMQYLADNFDVEMARDDGDFAATALRTGLVDELVSISDVRQRMIELVGADEDDESTFKQISFGDYVAIKRLLKPAIEKDDVVAVVVASGSIIDGNAPPGEIGGDSTARLLRKARTDDNVKAVVLRVDSGGGSAFASDVILQEIVNIKAAGKPVIASMGGVAASGGYWISMAADQIVANPDTITGSIGILGMVPTFEKSLARLGIYTDGIGTTNLAGALRADRALSDQVKRILQLNIENGYRDFVNGVSSNRGMSFDDVDAVAQGKVWIATDALDYGLVDTLGDLSDAIAIAAERAELAKDSYSVRYVEPELSAEEQFLLDLLSGSAKLGFNPALLLPKPGRVEQLIGEIETGLDSLARFNDPGGMYLECFCRVD